MNKISEDLPEVKSTNHYSDEQGAQTRITCATRVANCIDTLKFNWCVNFSDSNQFKSLEEAKLSAQTKDVDSEPLKLGGIEWNCMRTGTSMFSYRLVRGDIKLLISTREFKEDIKNSIPNVRLEIGSISCWSPGFTAIHGKIVQMLKDIDGEIEKEKIAEVHLAADFIGVDLRKLSVDKNSHWIAKGHRFASYCDQGKFTGITIGKGNLMLRVYDKAHEVKSYSHKKYFFEKIWDFDSYGESPVTRVEFQIRRPVLNEFKPTINNLAELNNSLASLWKYCTDNWARLADKEVDRNHHQSRAETCSWWEDVKGVKWNDLTPSYRNKRQLHKDLARVLMMLNGNSMSVGASYGCFPYDVDGVIKIACQTISSGLRSLYEKDPEEFAIRMECKRNDYLGIDAIPFGGLTFKG